MIVQSKPEMMLWQCTTKCNLNCSYCNIPGNKDYVMEKDEMYPSVTLLNITGGEPFINNAILQYKKLFPNLRQIQVSTNGHFPQNIINFVKQSKVPVSVTFSLHKESGKTIKQYKNLKRMKICRVGLQTTLDPTNLILHPGLSYIMPMDDEFYGSPIIQHTSLMMSFIKNKASKWSFVRPYYKNIIQTLADKRIMPCSFKENRARYLDVDGQLHRCSFPNKDCDTCYSMCDTVLLYKNHPLRMMLELLL